METRIGDADLSLVAVADGSTSLYFSNGGGIIGAVWLWPAYWLGREVITSMRLASEKMRH